MTFLALEKEHEDLNELFFGHQEALLKQDVRLALERLDVYETKLLAHMKLEEEQLLPLYARAGSIPGGPAEFFTGEHKKMREFLLRFRATLLRLDLPDPNITRALISLFDAEAAYKSLTEHHEMREHNLLYPTLDRVTTAEERMKLIGYLESEEKL